MKRKELIKRYMVFVAALFVSASGVSLITQARLGTSPISSIPYVLSLNSPLTMGTYIFILNMVLMLVQMLLLGVGGCREKWFDLAMQIPVSVLFGVFVDATMFLLEGLIPGSYAARLIGLVFGCMILAAGIVMEVVADVTMLSGEYTVGIAAKRFSKSFGNVKIGFDVSLVAIALGFSLALSGRIDGIGEGTVIAALLTGPFVRMLGPRLGWVGGWIKSPNFAIRLPLYRNRTEERREG